MEDRDAEDQDERARRINELLDAAKQKFADTKDKAQRAPDEVSEETADQPAAARKRMAKVTDTVAESEERKKA